MRVVSECLNNSFKWRPNWVGLACILTRPWFMFIMLSLKNWKVLPFYVSVFRIDWLTDVVAEIIYVLNSSQKVIRPCKLLPFLTLKCRREDFCTISDFPLSRISLRWSKDSTFFSISPEIWTFFFRSCNSTNSFRLLNTSVTLSPFPLNSIQLK
jgi:hypothetical protein